MSISAQQHQLRASIHTLGCKLNYAESADLKERFERLGYAIVPFGEATDVIVVNTCTVTEQADTECRKIIRRGLRTSPDAVVAVTGCYAQLQPEEIASIDGVKGIFGAAEKTSIPDRIDELRRTVSPRIYVSELTDDLAFVPARSSDSDSRTRAFVKLQDGCDYSCTFCTIPLARGHSRSMDYDKVMEEMADLERTGYSEVVLTGINLGEYRSVTGERLIDVMRAVDERSPSFRIRISSIEPNTVRQEHIDLVASSSVFCHHFHLPLQHGSADLLRSMRRRYNPDMYQDVLHRIVTAIPHAAIGIDVIVGFPGETDALFEESYDFIASLPFTYLHVFTYSEREHTPAASLPDPVPMRVRRVRTSKLRDLSERRRGEFQRRFEHTVQDVIPEAFDHTTSTWSGWTSNYVRVRFEGPPTLLKRRYRVLLGTASEGVVDASMLEAVELRAIPAMIDIPVHQEAMQ